MLYSFGLSFIGIFVALDIIGTLPMYLSLTSSLEKSQRNRILNTSMYVAFIVALIFVFLGERIFGFLGITISDFKIAGGIVLLLISLADLVGQHEASNRASGSTGIVPLAVPLITGPGVLTTLILQVNTYGYGITLLALAINYLLALFVLRHSGAVTRLIGNDGTVVISKIAALLLATIAIAMIRSGVVETIRAY
jgi:multiple antibiotic resistance protein